MKLLWFFLFCANLFGLDNAVRISSKTGSSQPGRPFSLARWFAKDEICNWPQPFVDGAPSAQWQADRVNRWPATEACPAGSVQFAVISFRADIPSSGAVTVDFRNHPGGPCAGETTEAGCAGLGLTMQGALDFLAAGWDAQMIFTARPQGTTTPRIINARTMLQDGRCQAWLKGPAVTQYVCGPYTAGGAGWDSARTYSFGWKERAMTRGTGASLTATATSIPVVDVSSFVGLARPFKITLFGEFPAERISICYVDAANKQLIVGTTNGDSPSCASQSGRGQDGTSAGIHYNRYIYLPDANDIRVGNADINQLATQIPVTDASAIPVPSVIKIMAEEVRICAKSGNTLIAGSGGAGCSGDTGGRFYRGTTQRCCSGSIPARSQVYLADSPDRWMDAPADIYRSINPVFVLTFYTGWPGVGVEYIAENTWQDRMQDQEYDVTFQTGTAAGSFTTVETKTERRHTVFTSWRYPDGSHSGLWKNDRKIWTASAPEEVHYDYNFPYLHYSGLIPNDPKVSISATAIANELTVNQPNANYTQPAWDNPNNSHCEIPGTNNLTGSFVNHAGNWQKDFGASAARGEIALNPRWFVMPLYAMSSNLPNAQRLWEVFWGNSACAGYPPMQYVEGTTGLKYCNAGESAADPSKSCSTPEFQEIDAFGYGINRDARPDVNILGLHENLKPVGHYTFNKWSIAPGDVTAHKGDFSFLPYMFSGDWYFYWIRQRTSHWALTNLVNVPGYNPNAASAAERSTYGHGSWSVMYHKNGHRGFSFGWRAMARAYITARDGTPEKEFWLKKLNTHIAVYEGKYNITDGNFYQPCPEPLNGQYDYSYWCFGRHFRGNGDPTVRNVITYDITGGRILENVDPLRVYTVGSDWMFNYWLVALGDSERQGVTQSRPLRLIVQRRMLNMILNRAEFPNPFLVQSYRAPLHPCLPEGTPNPNCGSQTFPPGAQIGFSSYAHLYNGYDAATRALNRLDSVALDGGYARIAHAAAAFLPDGVEEGSMTGQAAWDWFQANLPQRNRDGDNASWVLSPRSEVGNIRGTNVGPNQATILFVRPAEAASCSYTYGTERAASSLTTGEPVLQSGNREMSFTLTGLSPATTYFVRITCGVARAEAAFTTKP